MVRIYKRTIQDFDEPDKHKGVVTHLEADILECKVKWALGSIAVNKASRGDRIPGELFKILKSDAISAAPNMSANLENSTVITGLEKVNFHFNSREGQCQRMLKLPYNCTHFTCWQDYVQNPSSVCKPRTSRYTN